MTPKAGLPKAPRHYRRFVLGASIAALALAGVAGSASAQDPFTALTDIPMPRLNPQRGQDITVMSYSDPIAGLLEQRMDDAHAAVTDAEPPVELEVVVASKAQPPVKRASGSSVGLRYAIK
ncbi:MAG: hypothetical protein J0H08_07415, partial [Rhizobiales bacterium]|nr:hypothetical protein [Hyphomicrobiales bacterium]